MENLRNIPQLRFPKFKEEWEKNKLGEVVKINQGLQIDISERYTEKVDGSYFYITNQFLKVNSDKTYFIKNPPNSVLCTEKDILMTRTGNTGMVVTNVEGVFHNNFFKVAYPDYISKNFLYNFLKLENTQNQILRMAGTSTIPDLNHSDFYRIILSFPTKPEQTKIANFLTTIDEKIQALKKKKSILENYKKGVMQQLFSQQLRFKDTNGKAFSDWEVKKLGEVFFSEKGKGISKNKIVENGKFECILYGELYTKYKEVIFEVVSKTNELGGEKSKIGDLLIPSSTTTTGIDLANVTALNKENVLLGGDITVLRSQEEEINNVFYAYYLSNHKKEEIASYAQGSTIVHLYYSHIKDMMIDLPSYKEQTAIANFLSTIDKKINKTKTQITQTEQWKKGLLQKMFV